MANIPITEDIRSEWCSLAQLHLLEALMGARSWRPGEIAFHGGTSLHLSWASPRFSEDLDFLLNHDLSDDLPALMQRVQSRLAERLLVVDPGLRVEIRNKSSKLDRMGNFHVVVTRDGVLGRAMVKAEFWNVDADYLLRYPTEFRQPLRHGDIVARTSVLVPAATMQAAIADKLTALAGRPYLKWRDIFDVWWITTQTRGLQRDPGGAPGLVGRVLSSAVIEQYLHNRTGYAVGSLDEDVAAFRRFLSLDEAALIAQADKDLKPFLPRAYWEAIGRAGVAQMVAQCRDVVREAVEVVEAMAASESGAQTEEESRSHRGMTPGG